MNRLDLIEAVQKLAAELKETPTLPQFQNAVIGGGYHAKRLFGNYSSLLMAAKLPTYRDRRRPDVAPELSGKNIPEPAPLPPQSPHVMGPEPAQGSALEVAKLKRDLSAAREQLAELKDEVINSSTIRDLIGSLDTSRLGQDSEWIKGGKTPTQGLTGIPVLFLSDIHFDEVVIAEQIGGMNRFNREVARKRLQFTFQTTVDLLTHYLEKPRFEGIVLCLGGDLLSGNIHEELAETNEASINQSLIELSDILIAGIELLRSKFPKVFVTGVVGNHGRLHKKPRAKNRVFDNYEWLIYQILARQFRGVEGVSLYFPEGADSLFQVYGKRFCLTHGDQFRGGSGIAGIFSPLMLGMARKQRRQSAINQPFDILMMGHWHQLLMMENLIVNGSVKGYDEYAYISNFPFEKPQQALFVVHPEHGVTYRMPVICDGYEDRRRAPAPALSWG